MGAYDDWKTVCDEWEATTPCFCSREASDFCAECDQPICRKCVDKHECEGKCDVDQPSI